MVVCCRISHEAARLGLLAEDEAGFTITEFGWTVGATLC
jgi:hypothetical protein